MNELRVGFNRFNVVDTANSYGINENNNLGIPNGNIPGLLYTSESPSSISLAMLFPAGMEDRG